MSCYLDTYKQLNGFCFIIDERLRGCGLDKKMLLHNIEYVNNYDVVWLAVDNLLNTNKYWERIGFEELFHTIEAKYYIKFVKNISETEIFILKMLLSINEKNYNK